MHGTRSAVRRKNDGDDFAIPRIRRRTALLGGRIPAAIAGGMMRDEVDLHQAAQ